MKTSELYKYAQCAVVDCTELSTLTKLDILRVLMKDEDIELYTEEQEAKKTTQEEKANEAV
jgi:hypothetical protein